MPITTLVGNGRSIPTLVNMAANTGITFHSRMTTHKPATHMMTVG